MQKTIIEPNGKNLQYWKDIWRYRELALNLAKRDVTVRYKQTKIGLGWAIISPVVNMLIMTVIFGGLAKLEADGDAPYFIMVYAGTIPWTMFSSALRHGSGVFIQNAGLMKKVYYPRFISPLGACFASIIDSAIAMVVLIIMMLGAGYFPTVKFLLFPVFLLLCMLLGLFAGLLMSAFNVKWRDLQQAIPFLISIGQYITPVAYSIDSIPEKYALFYSLNPATGMINAFKWCIINTMEFDTRSFLIAVAWLIVLIPTGFILFRKTERTFIDIV